MEHNVETKIVVNRLLTCQTEAQSIVTLMTEFRSKRHTATINTFHAITGQLICLYLISGDLSTGKNSGKLKYLLLRISHYAYFVASKLHVLADEDAQLAVRS